MRTVKRKNTPLVLKRQTLVMIKQRKSDFRYMETMKDITEIIMIQYGIIESYKLYK